MKIESIYVCVGDSCVCKGEDGDIKGDGECVRERRKIVGEKMRGHGTGEWKFNSPEESRRERERGSETISHDTGIYSNGRVYRERMMPIFRYLFAC